MNFISYVLNMCYVLHTYKYQLFLAARCSSYFITSSDLSNAVFCQLEVFLLEVEDILLKTHIFPVLRHRNVVVGLG